VERIGGWDAYPNLWLTAGTTCYVSAPAQVIIHSEVLYEAMQQAPHKASCEAGVDKCLLCALVRRRQSGAHGPSMSLTVVVRAGGLHAGDP
jgi:hypothetical protein